MPTQIGGFVSIRKSVSNAANAIKQKRKFGYYLFGNGAKAKGVAYLNQLPVNR